MFSSIVVGTDGSATAGAAVQQAARLGRDSGATLHVVSAYRVANAHLAAPEVAMLAAAAVDAQTEQQKATEQLLDETASKLRAEGLHVETYLCRGDAADAIIDVAEHEKADLIVVGNKGMTGTRRFLLGSVPNKVSHHAPCSVMIVRTCD